MRRYVEPGIAALVLLGLAVAGWRLWSYAGPTSPAIVSRSGGGERILVRSHGTVASPFVGGVFSASNGNWSKAVSSYAYVWQDCDANGANCTTAAGSPTNTATYTIVAGDIGHAIKVIVTATFVSGGNATQTSLRTGVVSSQGRPINTSLPKISGIPMPSASGISGAGSLSVTNGSWTNSPTSYTYQWQDCDATGANCANATGPGATKNSYTVVPADTASSIRVRVTAHNSSGPGTAAAYTGPAPAFWYEEHATGAAVRDANLFRIIGQNPTYGSLIDGYHGANPHVKVIVYIAGVTSNVTNTGGNSCYDATAAWTQASAHPLSDPQYDWFLYNSRGYGSANRVGNTTYGSREYSMDVGNTYWQRDCATRNINTARSVHLTSGDGFFVDEIDLRMSDDPTWPSYPMTSAAGGYSGDAAWNNAYLSELTAWHTRYHAAGYIEIANIAYGGLGGAYQTSREAIARATDGSMQEGFVWPNAAQDSQWVYKVGEGAYNEAHGKWFLAVPNGGAPTDEGGNTYSMASFLMEANGHSLYDIEPVVNNGGAGCGTWPAKVCNWYPESTTAMQLGPARGAYYSRRIGGNTIYERDFTNGVVVANPSQNSIHAFAPEAGGHTYSGSGYTDASTVTMNADQGLILLRTG